MKRRTVRLMVFSGAGLVGLIAVAQAHYGRDSAPPQPVSPANEVDVSIAADVPSTAPPTLREGHEASPRDLPQPPAALSESAVSTAATRLPTRLASEAGTPDRYAEVPSARPSGTDINAGAMAAPVRLVADAASADLTSTHASPDAETGPATSQLLAMVEGTTDTVAAGDRYAPAAQPESDPRELPPPSGLPSTAGQAAAPPAVMGRLPARPRDRTMQPEHLDRAGAAADQPADAAEPHLAPRASGREAATISAMPGTAAAPNPIRATENDPFQTDAQLPAPGHAVDRAAPPMPAAGAQARAGGIAEGTGLPGAAGLEGPQAPSLTLEKRAPAEIQVGKECTFEIRIRNTGQVPAHGVTVRDEIPQKTRLVTCQPRPASAEGGQLQWDLGTLNVGEEAAIEIHLLPIAEGEVGSVATVEFQSRVSVRTIVTKPELAIRLSGPNKVMIGDEVALQIEISNPGSGAATGVILLEDVPAGLSHPSGERLELELGTIPPGQQRQLELLLTAKQAGLIKNLVTARADANLSVEADIDLEIIAPQLKVAIDGPRRRFLDRPATYTLTLENPGTAAAQNVELAAYLPKGMKFVEANNHGQYDATTHAVVWGLEELPAHERGNVQLVALPVEAGAQTLRVEGRAAQGLTDQAQKDITVEGVAAIKFEVVDLEDPIEVGGETNYKIHVVNQGSKAATQVQISALVPPDMKAIAASGPTQHAMEADRVVFAPLRRLAPKAEVTYQIKVQGLSSGDHRLRVQLVTDEIRRPVTKEESTRVYADE